MSLGLTEIENGQLDGILAYIGGGISVLSTGLLLIFYISIPEVRTFFVKILFYLSLCDFLGALSIFFIGSKSNNILCFIQAGFQQFFSFSTLLWMQAVAFTMFNQVCKHKQYMWKYEIAYHCLLWPLSIIATATMYALHSDITYQGIQHNFNPPCTLSDENMNRCLVLDWT